jgi:hypothetical protein
MREQKHEGAKVLWYVLRQNHSITADLAVCNCGYVPMAGRSLPGNLKLRTPSSPTCAADPHAATAMLQQSRGLPLNIGTPTPNASAATHHRTRKITGTATGALSVKDREKAIEVITITRMRAQIGRRGSPEPWM